MFKKSFVSAAVLACLTVTAHAQLNAGIKPQAPAAPVAAPVAPTVAVPAAVVVQQADAPKPEGVNPFTGKQLTAEARQRALELAKMETQLLEEQIRQAALKEDLRTIPAKKQVEEAQAVTARMKEEAIQREVKGTASGPAKAEVVNTASAATAALKPAAKAKTARPTKAKNAGAAETGATVAVRQPAAPAPTIELTSVMNIGGSRSAVLEVDGNILTVKHGDATPFGAVEILDAQSLRLGGQVLKVHGATLARVVISDPKIVDPLKAAQAPAPAIAVANPMATPPSAQFPSTAGQKTPQLPPLQLPQGVTIIPTGK